MSVLIFAFLHSIETYQTEQFDFANLNDFPGSTNSKSIFGSWKMDADKAPGYKYDYSITTRQEMPISLSSGSALEAMKSCDTSVALLTGPYTSLGALMAIVRQLYMKKNGGTWVVATLGARCTDTCSRQGLACSETSTSKQTGLDLPSKAKAAYEEEGYECRTVSQRRNADFAPYIYEEHNNWCSFLVPLGTDAATENPHVTVLVRIHADCAGVTLFRRAKT